MNGTLGSVARGGDGFGTLGGAIGERASFGMGGAGWVARPRRAATLAKALRMGG